MRCCLIADTLPLLSAVILVLNVLMKNQVFSEYPFKGTLLISRKMHFTHTHSLLHCVQVGVLVLR